MSSIFNLSLLFTIPVVPTQVPLIYKYPVVIVAKLGTGSPSIQNVADLYDLFKSARVIGGIDPTNLTP
jgi:hypothetical protein